MSATTFSINQHFSEAVEYLDENFAFFCTHVLNMGAPVLSGIVPTACVMVPLPPGAKPKDADEAKRMMAAVDTSKWEYHFNPTFAASLKVEDFAFVMAHETFHILLNHLALGKKFDHAKLFNIAADCVINDYLVSSMGFPMPTHHVDGTEIGMMTGEKNVGYNCANATVSEVYQDLLSKCSDEGIDPDNYMGNGVAIDDHDWIHGASHGQQGEAEAAGQGAPMPSELEDKKDDDDAQSTANACGKGEGESMQDFTDHKNVTMAWAKLLKIVDPLIFKAKGGPKPKPSYHSPRRKMMGFYPDVNLPVFVKDDRKIGGDEKPVIVFALDTSGSVSRDDVVKAYTLVQSIPKDRIEVMCCYFHDSAADLDLSTDNPKYTSGGTDFSAIQKWINRKVKEKGNPLKGKQPTAVVVLTDGMASFDSTKQVDGEAWHWLINNDHMLQSFAQNKTRGGYYNYGTPIEGEVHRLDDFVNVGALAGSR